MSWVFIDEATGKEIGAKTMGIVPGMMSKDLVLLGDHVISIKDFFFIAYYVLTNTNLYPGDPRLRFVECVKTMHEVEGYKWPGCGEVKRLKALIDPVVIEKLPQQKAQKTPKKRSQKKR